MNCKPGDLAYIVGCVFPENNGRVVEVLSAFGPSKDGDFCWLFHSSAKLHGTCEVTGQRIFVQDGIVLDSILRPISGVPVDDETPIETNIPEALQLALGIQARVWA